MKGWLFLVIAIVGEVIATSALKSSEGFTKLAPSAVVIMVNGSHFNFLSLGSESTCRVAYAVWSGTRRRSYYSHCLVAFMGKQLDAWGFVGMGLIIAAFCSPDPHRGSRCGGRRHGDGVRAF
ncbi:QacE family quaternary ammonium compound efflux SMR transporter (plasmid) [Klebsiella pneumoniae]|nr:QacE family quaternary ammonium compound efflux SMR transporter [Klebsiella pneumoniae]